jgi:hypothetical protein
VRLFGKVLFGLLLAAFAVPAAAQPLGGIYREQGINPNGTRYIGMAAIVPDGDGVQVTWWITRDIFKGAGRIEDGKLVVNWNRPDPVIYHLREGVLEGIWANGAAADRLELYAPISPEPAPDPLGQYRSDGINPNGTPYRAAAEITRRGEQFQFFWTAQGTSYSGLGRREGNLMIVDWGSVMPMIYALDPDGTLSGLFDAGRGSEKLTPLR